LIGKHKRNKNKKKETVFFIIVQFESYFKTEIAKCRFFHFLLIASLLLSLSVTMGGGRRYEYPKWVWSPSGGWWAEPVHWKRNSIVFMGFAALTTYWAYLALEPKTVCSVSLRCSSLFSEFPTDKIQT
jgi:hypothetical protein